MPEEKREYKLEPEKKSEIDARIEKTGVPIYMERLELSDTQKETLQKEIWKEWDEIKKERDDKGLEDLWDALDNQYEGVLEEDEARLFNIDRGTTQVKVDKVTSLIMQAYMESDPKYSISPRPEYSKQGGYDVCQKQSDFIDDRLDNLPFRDPEGMTVHSTVLKGTGILKITHKIKREWRKREERYQGSPMLVFDEQGNSKIDPQTGKQIIKNKGLEEFLQNWPEAVKDYPGYVEKLQKGEEINFIASYKDTTYNDPEFKYVDLKNFYCRLCTEGYEGLKTTKLTVERISYSWWDLKREEKQDNFYDIDLLADKYEKGKPTGKKKKDYENDEYDILECVYYCKLKDSDKEEIKVVLWFEEESKINIGAIMYPYFLIDCYYVPHYIMKKKPGFYQDGIGRRLTNSAIAGNAILNFTLEGAAIANTVTPITKDQDIIDQFLEKRFVHGIPLEAKGGDIRFLNEFMRPMDVNGLLSLLQYVKQDDDDKSRVSSLMSGRESAIDPTAPAQKTMALLAQSGVDIKDFQLAIGTAFNEIGYIILNLYYQMSREGRKFNLNAHAMQVTGQNPFSEISRNEMVARTNIQVLITTFDYDKINLKAELLAFWQMFRTEPLFARNPEAVHSLLNMIVKNWNPLLRNIEDQILPSLDEIKRMQAQVALQAVNTYIKAKTQNAQVTGTPAEFDMKELMPLVSDLVAEVATPPSPEVQKERAKQANG